MPDFLATYDLKNTTPSPYSEFLKQATHNGWRLWIAHDNTWYRLPNTTLEGTFVTREAAVKALEATRAATQTAIGVTVTLEKYVVTSSDAATFWSDVTQPIKK